MLTLLWGILPTRARLHRILPRVEMLLFCNICNMLDTPETIEHALGSCPANLGLPARLLENLRVFQPGAVPSQMLTLDFEIEPTLEFPMTWTV